MRVCSLRLGVFSLLLHDFQDHAAGGRAALRSGVDADGLLSSTGILLTVNVNPAGTGQFILRIILERLQLLGTSSRHISCHGNITKQYTPNRVD